MRLHRPLAHTGTLFLLAVIGCGTVTSNENDGGSGAAGTGSGAAGTGSGVAGTAAGGRGGASGAGGAVISGAGGSDRVGGRGGTSAGAAGTGSGAAGTGSGTAGTGSGAAGTGGTASGGRGGGAGTAAGGRGGTLGGGGTVGTGGTLGTGGAAAGGRGGATACPAAGCPALAIADLTGISTAAAAGFDAPGFRCKSLTVCGLASGCVYFSNDMLGSKQSGEDTFQDGAEASTPMPVKINIDAGAASQCNNPPVTLKATDYVMLTFDGGRQLAVYLPAFTGASLILYPASDGSTYYDAARTMPAGKPQ
jgi:hypothetical protein